MLPLLVNQIRSKIRSSFEMQNQAAEIKLRAERRAGEMLKAVPKEQGERRDLTLSTVDKVFYSDILKENNVAPAAAQRWQLEAEIPEERDRLTTTVNASRAYILYSTVFTGEKMVHLLPYTGFLTKTHQVITQCSVNYSVNSNSGGKMPDWKRKQESKGIG